jgi:pimeloyl-ACP methyl ester carboxylesterase
LLANEAPITPVVPGPEVDAFKKAQAALLNRYGVDAKSRHLKIQKPSLTVHVIDAGAGDPVVLLHGGGGFACLFAPLMGALQKEFRMFAPDRPGCGLTDKFDYRKTVLRDHAVDFVMSLLDALDLPKTALAGSSMGGLWALQFALAHPGRVTKLLLLGEPAGSPPIMTNPPPPWTNTPSFQGLRARYADRLVTDITDVPDEMVHVTLASRLLPGADVSWNTLIEKFKKDNQRAYQLRPELKNLQPPTLFIWGEQDRLGPPSLGEEMARMAPKARCEVVRDAGHLPWVDQTQICTQLVRDFLKT